MGSVEVQSAVAEGVSPARIWPRNRQPCQTACLQPTGLPEESHSELVSIEYSIPDPIRSASTW
eukprot:4289755-Amphidinium_carterae.1